MKKISFILLLLQIFSILFFDAIRTCCYNLNLSWTLSYLFPFILIVLLSLILILLLSKEKRFKHKMLFLSLAFVILFAPFGIAFAINPIYEGDLSKEGTKVNLNKVYEDFQESDFVVLTIPNCPFCKESTEKMNLLQKRNPELRLKYLICSSDSRSLNELRSMLHPKIKIELAKDLSSLVSLSNGKFPSFFKIKDKKAFYLWNNMQLGTRALDWIENENF